MFLFPHVPSEQHSTALPSHLTGGGSCRDTGGISGQFGPYCPGIWADIQDIGFMDQITGAGEGTKVLGPTRGEVAGIWE